MQSPVAQWKRIRLLIWGFWVRVPAGLYNFFFEFKNNLNYITFIIIIIISKVEVIEDVSFNNLIVTLFLFILSLSLPLIFIIFNNNL